MGLKIYLRVDRRTLTHARTVFGMAISHDELAAAFRRCGIECVQEYPQGNANDAERYTPADVADYLEMWLYGVPLDYPLPAERPPRGRVAYVRGVADKLSGLYRANLEACDIIFFASSVATAFHDSYLDIPVGVLSGGYDPVQFYPIERNFHESPFVFLLTGATDERKGSRKVCQAFSEAFANDANVQLLVLSPGETDLFVALREQYQSDPRMIFNVEVVSDRMTMLDRYYRRGHCLVYVSIAEGYGRMLPEAMATGMPAIVSKWSAQLDQFSADCGWWVEESEVAGGFHFAIVSDIARKMRMAYDNRDECIEKGIFAAKFAKNNCLWEAGIGKALPALSRLYSTGQVGNTI